ncbi:MAG: DUF6261 family protein [Tannerella sp.]|jgi:hypothetical protein|nr:DUF6261 family protein [Tannerella sp.]
MEIEIINSRRLTNALHMEFTSDRLGLFNKYGPDALKIRPQYDNFLLWANHEDACYKFVTKSILSEQKESADHARDTTLTGLLQGVNFMLLHFDPSFVEAAKRLKILLDTYNRPVAVRNLSYDAETAAITNLLQELNGKYDADVQLVGLNAWVTKLQEQNEAFRQLAAVYNEEQADRPELSLKDARTGVDTAYGDIVKRINASILIEGEQAYAPFVRELNALIKHYHDVLAQHQGRLKKEKNNTPAAES